MSISRWTAVILAALVVGWYVMGDKPAPQGGLGPEGVVLDADDAGLVAKGWHVYAENCASCHGANLEGQPDWRTRKADGRLPAPPHDASGHTWHHPDKVLFAVTKYGSAAVTGQPMESDMPIYNGVLSDQEIAAALAYIKSTWPPEIRARQESLNERTAAGEVPK